MDQAETLARLFHDIYERLAPSFDYRTREDSAVPWEQVPAPNKQLMIAVAREILEHHRDAFADEPAPPAPDNHEGQGQT